MSDKIREFLDTIRATPEDDQARLVLADLYEETGDVDRATLIRLQIERAALPPRDPKAIHIELKERQLLADHGERWRENLPKAEGVQWGRFSRGLVDKVAFDDATKLAEHGADCAAAGPLDHVMFKWPRLGDRPTLSAIDGLRELTVVGTVMEPDDVAWLANSPILSTVRALNLVESQMTAEAFQHLMASPFIEQLEALRVPVHNFGNEGIVALVSTKMPNLVDLDVSVATFDDLGSGGRYQETMSVEAARDLATWPQLANLRSLDVTGNQLTAEGVHDLLASPLIGKLKTLRLKSMSDWNWETDERPEVLQALSTANPDLKLEVLDIGESELSEELTNILVDAPALSELEELRMDYCQLGNSLKRLLEASWLDTLRVLSGNNNGTRFLTAVFDRQPARLHTLHVSNTYYHSRLEGLSGGLYLAKPLSSLLVLDLGAGEIDATEAATLGDIKSVPNLVQLTLCDEYRDETIAEEGIEAFMQSELGKRLVSIDLGDEAPSKLPPPQPVALIDGEYRGPLRFL